MVTQQSDSRPASYLGVRNTVSARKRLCPLPFDSKNTNVQIARPRGPMAPRCVPSRAGGGARDSRRRVGRRCGCSTCHECRPAAAGALLEPPKDLHRIAELDCAANCGHVCDRAELGLLDYDLNKVGNFIRYVRSAADAPSPLALGAACWAGRLGRANCFLGPAETERQRHHGVEGGRLLFCVCFNSVGA